MAKANTLSEILLVNFFQESNNQQSAPTSYAMMIHWTFLCSSTKNLISLHYRLIIICHISSFASPPLLPILQLIAAIFRGRRNLYTAVDAGPHISACPNELAWRAAKHLNASQMMTFGHAMGWKKKLSHFDLKNWVTGGTKIQPGIWIIGEYLSQIDSILRVNFNYSESLVEFQSRLWLIFLGQHDYIFFSVGYACGWWKYTVMDTLHLCDRLVCLMHCCCPSLHGISL